MTAPGTVRIGYAVDRIRDTYQPRVRLDVTLVVLAAVVTVVLAVAGAPFVVGAVVAAFGLLRLVDLIRVTVILRGVRDTPVLIELDRAGVVLHTERGAVRSTWDALEAVGLEKDGSLLRFVVPGSKDVTFAVHSLDVEEGRLGRSIAELSGGRHSL